jgi:hypothetical protein
MLMDSFVDGYLKKYVPLSGAANTSSLMKNKPMSVLKFFEKYVPFSLYKSERCILKYLYGNVDNYPEMEIDDQDKEWVRWHKENKGLDVAYQKEGYRTLVMIVGRGGGKSAFAGGIDAYETYRILIFENPNEVFNMPLTRIALTATSASKDQGAQLYGYIKEFMQKCEYIQPFIASEPSVNEIKIHTKKTFSESADPLFLVKLLPSRAKSSRSYRSYLVNIDELAFFYETHGGYSGDEMLESLIPSIKNIQAKKFNNFKFGKVVIMSSPAGKSGALYNYYKRFIESKTEDVLVFQAASWEFSDVLKYEDYADEFKRDPVAAGREYGANFSETLDNFFPPDRVESIFNRSRKIQDRGDTGHRYVAVLDLSKNRDRTVLVVGHREDRVVEHGKIAKIYIDTMRYWQAITIQEKDGVYRKVLPSYDEIEKTVIDLPMKAFNLICAVADQFNSIQMLQHFNNAGIPAFETTFTNQYKDVIYPNLLTTIMNGNIECYGVEYDMTENSSVALAEKELKFLQREIRGKTVSYHAPTSGEVTNDDFADAIANLAYILLSDNAIKENKVTRNISDEDEPLVAQIRGFG